VTIFDVHGNQVTLKQGQPSFVGGAIGVKVSYSRAIGTRGAQKRTITIYTTSGVDWTIDLVTPPETPEFPVDVETPTVSPS
jgi:hypothetical protein